MFRRGAEHHHTAVLAETLGVGVEKHIELIELLQAADVAGIKHRTLHLAGGRRREGRRGGGDRVGGAEQLLHVCGQAPCPGDDHRVDQAWLAAAVALQRQGLRQADGLGQATAPGGVNKR